MRFADCQSFKVSRRMRASFDLWNCLTPVFANTRPWSQQQATDSKREGRPRSSSKVRKPKA
jgi:hypothetical protein